MPDDHPRARPASRRRPMAGCHCRSSEEIGGILGCAGSPMGSSEVCATCGGAGRKVEGRFRQGLVGLLLVRAQADEILVRNGGTAWNCAAWLKCGPGWPLALMIPLESRFLTLS